MSMEPEEALVVLTSLALFDPRIKPSADMAEAWAELLHRETLDECLDAVKLMVRDTDAWPHPATLLRYVRIVRDNRYRDERRAVALARPAPAAALPQLRRVPEPEQPRALPELPPTRSARFRDPDGMAAARRELEQLRAQSPADEQPTG